MENKKQLQKINWVVFATLVVIFVLFSYNQTINTVTSSSLDGPQSRIDFGMSGFSTSFLIILLFLSALLVIGWKRLFPFNVPIAIVLLGFYFQFLFIIFTTGWIGFAGTFILAICVAVSLIMIISYAIYLLKYKEESRVK
ncbi:hypothetical protein WAK64_19610 [Bacillus spongiae]|uniref:RND transporter n=1 Tax=Bacillus spongiae TaxID=2683610 RepID=A0ABU8HJ11_9BACI